MSESLNDFLPLSPDHNAERLATLKKLFPDLFSNDGRLNADELKKVVDPALVSETERYDFRWYGKTKSKREAFTPSRTALVYDSARSVNPAKAGGNMIIEGENLEVLKLLTSAYRERIKCIYIDPPYNTGNDFVYSDNYAEGRKPYWEQTSVTENGVKVDTNTDSDGRFHSNWLSMMHSRLLVARYLLKPDGVIFASIDDNEVQNLRRVMDEVFGEENFVATFVWQKKYAVSSDDPGIGVMHDYILVFQKSESFERQLLPRTEKQLDRYTNPDNDPRGVWSSDNYVSNKSREERPTLWYSIKHPKTNEDVWPDEHAVWRYSHDKHLQMVTENRLYWGPDQSYKKPRLKRFLGEIQDGVVPSTWLPFSDCGHNDEATKETGEILGRKAFDTPKPVRLLKNLLMVGCGKNDLILDFFAGSGTTAQAVMELNEGDGGNRKFILVQLPELTAEDSSAFKSGFKRISEITIERAKRVVLKLKAESEALLPNDPQRQFADSLGFKVYTLAKSVFPRAEFAPDSGKTEAENIDLLKQYIREKEATFHLQFEKDKVLDEVLLKNGFTLDYTLTRQHDFGKNEVFLAKDMHKESLICLDSIIEPETVDHFKTHKDRFFICLELALDTTKKWNLKHNVGEKLKAF